MDGVIFIRTLSEQQEEILENFKSIKNISANTKAVQGIISEYGRLENNEKSLNKTIQDQKEKIWKLENQMEEYNEFFELLKKFTKTKKSKEL